MGLGHDFKKFPRHQMLVYFSNTYNQQKNFYDDEKYTFNSTTFQARTNEGLRIQMDIACHFQLISGKEDASDEEKGEQLIEILERYGEDGWHK